MVKKFLFLFAALFLAALLSGCDDSALLEDESGAQTNRVMATVNGVPLMSDTLEMYIATWGEEYEKNHEPVDYALLKRMRTQKLEQMINEELVKQRLKECSMTVSEEEIKEHISKMIDDLGGSDNFINFLQERGYVTLEELEKNVRDDILALKVFSKDMGIKQPTEEEVKKCYEEVKEALVVPARIWLSHIQVSFDTRMLPDGSKEVFADEYLRYIKDQIEHKYISFAKAARDYSSCRSAQHDGAVGMILETDTVTVPQEIHDAAFKLAVSNVSDVVVSPLGAHLLYVTRREEAHTNTYEESKLLLLQYMARDVLEKNRDEWLLFLRNRADIHYNEMP
ncbi:SurA N-terminal domain-containing protein [bacterium]|nr:SurA N-terminal domain-containing protein [bacterium]